MIIAVQFLKDSASKSIRLKASGEVVTVRAVKMSPAKVTFEDVERELRGRNFGILSTVSRDGRSHSTGVMYGVSPQSPVEIYVITRTTNKKVRNIAVNPGVSFVVPLFRRFLSFVPPNCIQFQGTAQIVDARDERATRAFGASYMLRMILRLESEMVTRTWEKACFIRILPDPAIFTYGLGLSVWQLRKHIEDAASKVEAPGNAKRS